MIPKILHFIWFGNNIPKYVKFSIENFKKVNPTFDIHFLNYTILQIEHISIKTIDDQLLMLCIQSILNNELKYRNIILHCKKNKLKFVLMLSDIYRLEILNYYGGIYLDCDCFPIRQFDDELLNKNLFIVLRHFSYNSLENDNYFIGTNRNEELWDIFDIEKTKNIYKIVLTEKNWYNSLQYYKLKKQFIECKLEIGSYISHNNFYIDHYSLLTWKDLGKGILTPICAYDKKYNI